MLGQREAAVLDLDAPAAAGGGVRAQIHQLFRLDGVPGDPVEESQQPRSALLERPGLRGVAVIPHLRRTSDELVPAWAFHAVDAEVRPTDPDGVFGGPGAGGVVLGRDQTMTRIERRRDRRSEVDVTESEHHVFGAEDGVEHVVHGFETVHPADELDVPRAPRRVGANPVHVPLDRFARCRVVPRQWHPHSATGHNEFVGRRQGVLRLGEHSHQLADGQHVRVDADLQAADSRGEIE